MNSVVNEYLDLCNYLASKGYGYTSSNPMVGAVLVHNHRIIGQGWHQQFGKEHAEVNCIASVIDADRHLIPESTMYVSLEPCNHFGKTPPCSHLIVEHRIPKVVVGYQDFNEVVNGSGIQYLKDNGVEVVCCQYEPSYELNKHFFIAHQKKRPFITLKWAESLDGYIGTGYKYRVLLSGKEVQNWVHYQRFGHQAILVGASTILCDDPILDVRNLHVSDEIIKVIWDREGDLTGDFRIFKSSVLKIIFTSNPDMKDRFHNYPEVEIVLMHEDNYLNHTLDFLYKRHIMSVYVEGGKKALETFLQDMIFDEIHRITTLALSQELKVQAPVIPHDLTIHEHFMLGHDVVHILKINHE